MKKIYADIYSFVKNKKNINNSDKLEWPISEVEFTRFYNEVLSNYELLALAQKKSIRNLILADFINFKSEKIPKIKTAPEKRIKE